MPNRLVVALGLLLVLAFAQPVGATIQDFKSFKEAYPDKEAKAYSCKICHLKAMGKKDELNAYGQALVELKAPDDAKSLIVEDFRAIEEGDADEDGATNLQELEAGTDPSDPESVPEELEQTENEAVEEEAVVEPSAKLWERIGTYVAQLVVPSAWATEGDAAAEYVGNETCAMCHQDQLKSFQRSTHAAFMIDVEEEGQPAEGCESCHGPGSLHADAGGDETKIIRYDPDQCFSCHLDKRAQFQLQFHHPVPEGRVACTDCHDLHAADARAVVSTALNRGDEVCVRCHKELKGPFIFEHDAMREGCTACHEPHGTPYDKLLVAAQSSVCLRCHWEAAVDTAAGTIGGVDHGTHAGSGGEYDIGRGEECIDHHRAPHGSNIWRTFNR